MGSRESAGSRETVTETKPAPPGSAIPVAVAEIERKFEPGPGFQLPDLTTVPGVASVTEPRVHDLDATYFDTADLRLARNKITLRRRTGGDDAGWHLKRPRTGGDREELHAPLGSSVTDVPPELRAPVEVHLRGAALAPVVRLGTARTVLHLLDGDGRVLVEVAQDDVTAETLAADGHSTTVSAWHELEVELASGDLGLLAKVCRRVVDAGAPASSSASKLSRALGDRLPSPAPGPGSGTGAVPAGSAGEILLAHLREHSARLKASDPLVRADAADAVHQMRVACRRLRSALATYRPLLDRDVTEPLRAELRWLGEVLGAARDAEVIRDELAALAAVQPRELVRGPVGERIALTLGGRYRAAHDEVLVTLGGSRYFALLDSLDRLLTDPPLTPAAAGPPGPVLYPLVRRTLTRMRPLVKAARAKGVEPDQRSELLHEVRKAAKRARYAGESLIPAAGAPAREWAAAMEAIQESLGAHQDSVVIRAELLALADVAQASGEETFTYGRLHAVEEQRAATLRDELADRWRAARKASLSRWLHPHATA